MSFGIIIPFRGTISGKQRLTKYLSLEQRKRLLKHLAQHVILVSNEITLEHRVYLLTKEKMVSFCGKYKMLLDKNVKADLNQALKDAIGYVKEDYVLILMADLPYISVSLIMEIISIIKSENKIIICPSQDEGTSILGFPKKYKFPFFFGTKSSKEFVKYFKQNNFPYVMLDFRPEFSDLDTQEDLNIFIEKTNRFNDLFNRKSEE